MKQLVIPSGKGGTGKNCIAAFALSEELMKLLKQDVGDL